MVYNSPRIICHQCEPVQKDATYNPHHDKDNSTVVITLMRPILLYSDVGDPDNDDGVRCIEGRTEINNYIVLSSRLIECK